MADDKNSDETAKASDDKAEDAIVEVEVIEDPSEATDKAEAVEAEADTSEEETSSAEDPIASEEKERSPGMVLFGAFIIAMIAVFGFFKLTGGDKPADHTSSAIVDADPAATAVTPSDETVATETTATLGSDTPEANPTDEPSENLSVTENSAATVEPAENDAVEAAADLFAADPADDLNDDAQLTATNGVSTDQSEPVNPRAAIAALQREAEQKAEKALSPAEATAAVEDAVDATTTAVTNAGETAIEAADEVATIDETVETDAGSKTANTINNDAGEELAEANEVGDVDVAAAENDDNTLATQGADALAQKDFSTFSEAVPADTGKIANDLEELKTALRQETDALNAAVTEGRDLTEQQSARITELRQSLEQALAERDEKANTEIAELRARLDKIQSGSADIPAGRQATASLALLSLQRAVTDGAPYTDELDVLEKMVPDGANLGALYTSAGTGVPTLAALKASFSPAVRKALAAADGDTPKGIMGRISKLVSVRPATPQPGERPANVISRAEYRLSQDDLAGAVEELSILEGAASEAFTDWNSEAQRRLNAMSAIDDLNNALLNQYDQ